MTIAFVLTILVEQILAKCRKLVVIHHHSEAFGGMLSDERVNDTKRLTRSRSTQYNSATERIDNIDPSLVHPPIEVINHRNIHRILIRSQFFRLFKGFVLEVKPILTKLVVIIAGDTITSLMNQHRTNDT